MASSRRLAVVAVLLLALANPSTSKKPKKDEVPTVDVTGDLEWRAVKCAACDYLVQRLDTLTSTALIEGTVVASVRRKKGKRAVKDVPWTKSELGWGAAVEETCEFASLKSLAYLTKDGEYKLLDTAEMSPTMAEAAAEQVLGRDRKAFTQFQTACQDVIDDNDRALVAVVRDAERKKMPVGAANPGGGGGEEVTDGYVPTIGRDGLKHRFCVETAKVCGTDRWPPAVKAEL